MRTRQRYRTVETGLARAIAAGHVVSYGLDERPEAVGRRWLVLVPDGQEFRFSLRGVERFLEELRDDTLSPKAGTPQKEAT